MLVRDILSNKQIGKIISVATTDTVSGAAELLSGMRIGAVIVRDEGNEMDGILSERDIVRELGRSGSDCLTKPVSSIMTSNVKSCAPTDTTQQVMQMMTDGLKLSAGKSLRSGAVLKRPSILLESTSNHSGRPSCSAMASESWIRTCWRDFSRTATTSLGLTW